MFICGSGSFGHEDETERYSSPCSTPKRSKKSNTNFCRIGKDHSSSKNPYADRGLDKFYALLAELDDKKQKIYTQVGSDEISLVRFVYPNDSNQVRPIVVKTKERNQERDTQGLVKNQRGNNPATNLAVPAAVQVQGKIGSSAIPDHEEAKRTISFRLENLRRPYYYIPLILVLILLFLVVYGRSFAILCTSIGWYLIPTVSGGNSSASTRSLKRKKETARKLSEKTMVNNEGSSSPTSVLNGLDADRSPQEQEFGRRRSF